MKVKITAEDNVSRFVEITEEQYKFWNWLEEEYAYTNISDIEIVDFENIAFETIN